MPKALNLIGERFGSLTVVECGPRKPVGKRPVVKRTWVCLCDCGRTATVKTDALRSGQTKSCGCQQCAPKYSGDYANLVACFRNYQFQAKRRGYDFELSVEQFHLLTSEQCFYCGEPPLQEYRTTGNPKPESYRYNGLDRKDNNEGYSLRNTVACCMTCNYMKRAMSVDRFIQHIRSIYAHQHGKEATCQLSR
jgi:hypothetical protein